MGLYGVCLRLVFFFQAEDGIRDLVRSRGLGDVYKRQAFGPDRIPAPIQLDFRHPPGNDERDRRRLQRR